jgi:hypothetical protein
LEFNISGRGKLLLVRTYIGCFELKQEKGIYLESNNYLNKSIVSDFDKNCT